MNHLWRVKFNTKGNVEDVLYVQTPIDVDDLSYRKSFEQACAEWQKAVKALKKEEPRLWSVDYVGQVYDSSPHK